MNPPSEGHEMHFHSHKKSWRWAAGLHAHDCSLPGGSAVTSSPYHIGTHAQQNRMCFTSLPLLCRRFHDIALLSPELWTFFAVNVNLPAVINRHLVLSKPAPPMAKFKYASTMASLPVQPVISREAKFSHLNWVSLQRWETLALERLSDKADIPSLDLLSLKDLPFRCTTESKKTLFSKVPPPQISELSWYTCMVDAISFHQANSLPPSNPSSLGKANPLSELHKFLLSTRNLTELILELMNFNYDWTPANDRINLPYVDALGFSARILSKWLYLGCLKLTVVTDLLSGNSQLDQSSFHVWLGNKLPHKPIRDPPLNGICSPRQWTGRSIDRRDTWVVFVPQAAKHEDDGKFRIGFVVGGCSKGSLSWPPVDAHELSFRWPPVFMRNASHCIDTTTLEITTDIAEQGRYWSTSLWYESNFHGSWRILDHISDRMDK